MEKSDSETMSEISDVRSGAFSEDKSPSEAPTPSSFSRE
jgi:hypothetical protein